MLTSAVLSMSAAHAARPLATDDAGVLATRDCELEPYGARLSLPGTARESSLSIQASCGVGSGVQAAFAYGRSNRRDPDNGNRRESMLVSGKALLTTNAQRTGVALSAGSVLGRVGNAPFRFDAHYLGVVVSHEFGAGLTGHANVGWVRNLADHQATTTWNLALEAATPMAVDVGLELYGNDRSRPWAGLGLRLSAGSSLKLGASYAVQADSLRQRQITLGATASF